MGYLGPLTGDFLFVLTALWLLFSLFVALNYYCTKLSCPFNRFHLTCAPFAQTKSDRCGITFTICSWICQKEANERANTEFAKKVCPRLRDPATAPAGGITQPRTHFLAKLCTQCSAYQTNTTSDGMIILPSVDNFMQQEHKADSWSSELIGCLELGNVWGLVQLISIPSWPINQLNKNPNIA